MPYITLEEHLPGITGLLEYRQDSGQPIRELTQILMRGPSTLSEGERELIASVVSNGNHCTFCTTAHTAAADLLIGDHETSEKAKQDVNTAPISEKMKALLEIALLTRENGKSVTKSAIEKAKDADATDLEIHDTVLIAAAFCMYNKYVDGLATRTPADDAVYQEMGDRLSAHGYFFGREELKKIYALL